MKALDIINSTELSDTKKIQLLTVSKNSEITKTYIDYFAGIQKIKDRTHPTDPSKNSKINKLVFNVYKKIIETAVYFMFGEEPVLKLNNPTDKNLQLFEEFKLSYNAAKTSELNINISRETFAYTEAAELCYWKNGKVRYQFLSSLNETFYPHFDETGDMDAFVRMYQIEELVGNAKKMITYCEVYLPEYMLKYQKVGNAYKLLTGPTDITEETVLEDQEFLTKPFLTYKKIPIVYYSMDEPLSWQVKELLDRFNLLGSTLGDVNDYFAFPILKLLGEPVVNDETGQEKLERNTPQVMHLKVSEEIKSDAEFLDWNSKPESAIFELNNLFRFAYLLTSTPDLSFENLKGLTSISGIALKLMFTDAIANSKTLSNVFFKLQRRINIHKSLMTEFTKKDFDSLDISAEFKSPIPENITELMQSLTSAYNSGIMSLETALGNNPYVSNVEDEMTRIEKVETSGESFNL